ncbi:hypothetical protein [Agrococcus terreus]|uniref:Lipoprotein n=1 Tax=Agrococcus terreus TaxID=574649 RepID=A0ABQ2KN90_9MICO|nr:hypothetical protein [Agrococcus terreus]GGN86507.1 hypothetical protein GCM10010968_20160 [Agrococcus terreus]
MRAAARATAPAAVLAAAVLLGGCAADDGLESISVERAAAQHRAAMCTVLDGDGDLQAAIERGDADEIAEAALERVRQLDGIGPIGGEDEVWPEGAEAAWRVEEELRHELDWAMAVADAGWAEGAARIPAPGAEERDRLDREAREALGLPLDDAELCRP